MHSSTHITPGCQFASDNTAGICPEAWAALEKANQDYASPYGEDAWTKQARRLINELFETDCRVFFTFNGTAANSLALAALCQPYHGVICADVSHVETDECGGPSFYTGGAKLLAVETHQGRLSASAIERTFRNRSDVHFPKPRLATLTQATEWGTVYRPQQIAEIGELCRSLGLGLHLDGARLANALATLQCPAKELTWQAGVQVVSLGGAKTGAASGEAVVFFDAELASEFEYRCKQAGQLASKMRFLTAPWVGMLETGAWLRHALHANQSAARLQRLLLATPRVKLLVPCEANAVFVELPRAWIARLRERGWKFYTFIGEAGVRLMCSWRTREEEIDALVTAIQKLASED